MLLQSTWRACRSSSKERKENGRNDSKYVRQGRDIAARRQMVGAGAAKQATEQLTESQVQSILHEYIDDFIHNEADDTQRAQPWNTNNSKAEAVLHKARQV